MFVSTAIPELERQTTRATRRQTTPRDTTTAEDYCEISERFSSLHNLDIKKTSE